MTRDLGICSNLQALQHLVDDVSGMVVVDIGSGDGTFARSLAEAGAEVSGFDPLGPEQAWTTTGAGRYRQVRREADTLPLPDRSIDLVLFIYSLHHIPAKVLPTMLAEVRRVLRKAGRLYVAEPLAEGPMQQVTGLFHDETAVRQRAATILAAHTPELFRHHEKVSYRNRRVYRDFDDYARLMAASMRFNDFTETQLRAPAVRERFNSVSATLDGIFDQPVRIDLLRP